MRHGTGQTSTRRPPINGIRCTSPDAHTAQARDTWIQSDTWASEGTHRFLLSRPTVGKPPSLGVMDSAQWDGGGSVGLRNSSAGPDHAAADMPTRTSKAAINANLGSPRLPKGPLAERRRGREEYHRGPGVPKRNQAGTQVVPARVASKNCGKA